MVKSGNFNVFYLFLFVIILVVSISCTRSNAGHHFKNGNANYNLKDYVGAIRDLDMAIELNPQYTEAYYVRALCNSKLNNYPKALNDFNKVIELDPEFKDAYINRAYYVKEKTGDYLGAIDDCNKFIELNSDNNNSFAYNNRGFAKFMLNDTIGAMDDIQMSLSLNPENSYAFKNRALIYIALDSISKACEDLNKAELLGYSKDYDQEAIKLIAEYCQSN
ncbi:MAG: tetratricopeptide repeat protein [Bacteroidales bacterium]|nr:tetratricopeptide repeat protein [Bacteroidales bacterium]